MEETLKALEETLKAQSDLLSQILNTSARTLMELEQKRTLNMDINNMPTSSTLNSAGVTQFSSNVVNPLNTTKQFSSSSAESVKYMIVTDGTGNSIDEPLEVQLAEEDGALNLNSPGDSERLAPEEEYPITTECNTNNNTMSTQQSLSPKPIISTTASIRQPAKKRKLNYENGNPADVSPETQNITSSLAPPIQKTTENNSASQKIVMVDIGANKTQVPAKVFYNMNWSSASIATRKLLKVIFGSRTLATHSMTGKPSPAFKDLNKPIKQKLDPMIVQDIISVVTDKCNTSERIVRNAITTKCADENKMMRTQMKKRVVMSEILEENLAAE